MDQERSGLASKKTLLVSINVIECYMKMSNKWLDTLGPFVKCKLKKNKWKYNP